MTIIKNYLLKFQNYAFIIIIFCIPKIDLIDVPNYHQGIRLEDILLFIIFFILLLSNKLFFKREDIGSNFILFFPYLFFVYIISFYIIDRVPSLAIIIRYLQYIVLIIYLSKINVEKKFIKKICYYLLLINGLLVLLQVNGIVGTFTSLGYILPENIENNRYAGLYGGSWELGNAVIIIFYIITSDKNLKPITFVLFLIITFLLILESKTKTAMFAFVVSLLFKYKDYVISKIIIILPLIYLALFLFFNLEIINLNKDSFFEKLFKLDLKYIYKIFFDFFINQTQHELTGFNTEYWSLIYRTRHWEYSYSIFLSSLPSMFIGTISTEIYYDSLILRILFNFGIIGSIIIFFLALRNIPIYFLVYLIISGLTLDILISFKLFSLILLYFYSLKPQRINDFRN